LQAAPQRQAYFGQAVVSTPPLHPLVGLTRPRFTHGKSP
jgi:hypothetical protein